MNGFKLAELSHRTRMQGIDPQGGLNLMSEAELDRRRDERIAAQQHATPKAPPDIDAQHALWGANCGPAAIAACLGITVAEVRKHVEAAQNGTFMGYMNATHITNALRHARRDARRSDCVKGEVMWPERGGVCVLQFDGPWCRPEVHKAARFRYTHSVASMNGGALIYDVNAGVWMPCEQWEREVMAFLVRDQKRATGWYTSSVIEVVR